MAIVIFNRLHQPNILPLMVVLMSGKHEKHAGRFYCYHFMQRMDYDLRQIVYQGQYIFLQKSIKKLCII